MRPVTLRTADASGGEQATEVCPLDIYLNPFSLSLLARVTGTATFTVEWTQDDVFAEDFDPVAATWVAVAGMDDATEADSPATATFNQPIRGIRMRQTAGDGSVELTIVQGGAL